MDTSDHPSSKRKMKINDSSFFEKKESRPGPWWNDFYWVITSVIQFCFEICSDRSTVGKNCSSGCKNFDITKGQLISKGIFAILEFFQKNERNNSIGKKTNSFVRFLEESSAWKKHYDFVWPLEQWKVRTIFEIKYFFTCYLRFQSEH